MKILFLQLTFKRETKLSKFVWDHDTVAISWKITTVIWSVIGWNHFLGKASDKTLKRLRAQFNWGLNVKQFCFAVLFRKKTVLVFQFCFAVLFCTKDASFLSRRFVSQITSSCFALSFRIKVASFACFLSRSFVLQVTSFCFTVFFSQITDSSCFAVLFYKLPVSCLAICFAN